MWTAMGSAEELKLNSARLMQDLNALSQFTSIEQPERGTAVTRIVFSEEDRHAREWLKQRAREARLQVREDAVGNTFFRWQGTEPDLPPVGTGSHIDAIPHAGMYDGTVGVLGGLEAIRAMEESGFVPMRSIELLLFTSEEPTRFGIGCLGSRLLSGVLDPENAEGLRGAQRGNELETLGEVRRAAGFHGSLASVPLRQGYYHGWVELHIEQGPLLERERIALGVVNAIAAPASYRFEVEGIGGHAGALLMPDRRDALCAASEIILSLERHAKATNAIDTVATVGTCDVYPGAVNSVPSRVTLQVDIRDIDPKRREAVMEAVRKDIEGLISRREVKVTETLVNADEPAICSEHVVRLITEVCREYGISEKQMVSRAYHDSLFMARIAPIGMIFIPCRGGVSHRPDEYAAPEDIVNGTRVLATTLARLAMER